MPTRYLIIPWQLLSLTGFIGVGFATGLGIRLWMVLLGILCGAACHAWWQRHRGAGPLTLPMVRRTTVVSAVATALACAAASLWLSTAPTNERIIAAIGTFLVTGFAGGVLTLCGLSLGLGSAQPTTLILPDPAHPNTPRRPTS